MSNARRLHKLNSELVIYDNGVENIAWKQGAASGYEYSLTKNANDILLHAKSISGTSAQIYLQSVSVFDLSRYTLIEVNFERKNTGYAVLACRIGGGDGDQNGSYGDIITDNSTVYSVYTDFTIQIALPATGTNYIKIICAAINSAVDVKIKKITLKSW